MIGDCSHYFIPALPGWQTLYCYGQSMRPMSKMPPLRGMRQASDHLCCWWCCWVFLVEWEIWPVLERRLRETAAEASFYGDRARDTIILELSKKPFRQEIKVLSQIFWNTYYHEKHFLRFSLNMTNK